MTDPVTQKLSPLLEAETLFRSGRHGEAASLCDRTLANEPENARLLHLRAVIAIALGDVALAETYLRRTIALDPGDAQAQQNLGAVLATAARLDEAIQHFEAASRLTPDDAGMLANYGRALRQLGRRGEAETAFRRITERQPGRADAWHGLGQLALDRDDPETAVRHLRNAAERDPKSVSILADFGSALRATNRIEAALEIYRRALAIDPENGPVLARITHQLERACAWTEAAKLRTRLIARSNASIAAGQRSDELPFAQLAYEDDPARILALARNVSAGIAARAGAPLAPAQPDRDPDRILKIGLLSHDFRNHAVAQLSHRVFERLDRGAFHVGAYSTGPDDGSALRRAISDHVDRFRDIRALSHRAAAEAMRADAIDILVDLTGHTSGSRLDIAALKPAPIQASWLGYPGTSGADFIDWLIADGHVLPKGDERYCSEAICRLPDTYMPTDDRQAIAADIPSRASQGLPESGFVFCSFNNMHKIEPVMFALWMELLREMPGSVLWLHAYSEIAAANLRKAAARENVDPARLVFADRPTKDVHLARASLAGLALDTRLYNGHTTTIDMLWAGVPVVTAPGRTFQARVSSGLLASIGLPELIVPDLAGYKAIALDLARNPAKLASLRTKLAANRGTMPLFDATRFARHLERGFRTMWQIYCAGRTPVSFDVGAIA
ncbi:MAG: tetratricopeptide repeat protein [Dongiaceae bacterium]